MYGDQTIAFRALQCLGKTPDEDRRMLMLLAQVYHSKKAKDVFVVPANLAKLRKSLITTSVMSPDEFMFVARGFECMRQMKRVRRKSTRQKSLHDVLDSCDDEVIRACIRALVPNEGDASTRTVYSCRLPLVECGLWSLIEYDSSLLRGTLALTALQSISPDHPDAKVLDKLVRERCPLWIAAMATTRGSLQIGIKVACCEIQKIAESGRADVRQLWDAFKVSMDALMPLGNASVR